MDDSDISSCFQSDYYFYGLSENRFCERWAEHYHEHEYINAFSALFIVGMGFYQLTWDHPYGIIRFLGGCFFVNGISSFLNHWYATRDWSIMDNASMYIPSWILLASLAEDLHLMALYYHKVLPNSYSRVIRPLSSGSIWGFTCLVIFFLLYNDMNGCEWGFLSQLTFILGFAVPPVILVVLGFFTVHYAYEVINDRYNANDRYYAHRFEQSVVYFSWGVTLALIGAALWITLEIGICPNVNPKTRAIVAYFPVHSLWHILESYAMSLLLLFFVSLSALRDQLRIDARFAAVNNDSYLALKSPDFALKSGKNRFIGSRCCCCCCPMLQSRAFDKCLCIIFPIPTKLYGEKDTLATADIGGRRSHTIDEKCCCACLRDLDTTYVTQKGGCCRCWIDCLEWAPCCPCNKYHYPVPPQSHDDTTDLIAYENGQRESLMHE